MEIINKEIKSKDYEVGVVVARFQIDELHKGHSGILDFVTSKHKKVIVFLGVSKVTYTKKNPMNFETRKLMVKSLYPNVEVFPIHDQGKSEKGNQKWSDNLDAACMAPFGHTSVLLYGSRDSFIPHYKGKLQTAEVSQEHQIDATSVRDKIGSSPEDSPAFRRGCIYTAYNLRPTVYPTVDVVVANGKGQILLVRKPNETLFRFAGGFVDPTDKNLEMAARRELHEETTLSCLGLRYITSTLVDDERYQNEDSKIMTSLFLTYTWDQMGEAEPSDDLKGGEVKWFDVHLLSSPEEIETLIMREHRGLMLELINQIYDNKILTNIKPRTWENPTRWETKF